MYQFSLFVFQQKLQKARWMEAVHHQLHFELEKGMKPYSIDIPVISFTHISEKSATDEIKLKEFNNNHIEKSSDNEHFRSCYDHGVEQAPSNDSKPDISLSQRMKELRRCIDWIHNEIVSMYMYM